MENPTTFLRGLLRGSESKAMTPFQCPHFEFLTTPILCEWRRKWPKFFKTCQDCRVFEKSDHHPDHHPDDHDREFRDPNGWALHRSMNFELHGSNFRKRR
jgi:hypothetical protein